MKFRLLPAFSATAFFLSTSWLVTGCGGPVTPAETSSAPTPVAPTERLTASEIESPISGAEVQLSLINESERLHVGDPVDDVFARSFPKPDRAASISQLPPSLDETFRGRGWESAEDSFGAILKNGRVALAIHTTERADAERYQEIIANYQQRFGEPGETILGKKISYRFWQDRDIRLMICNAFDEKGRMAVTEAIGLKTLMTHLRMDPVNARSDRDEAEKLLRNETRPSETSQAPAAS